MGKEGNDDSEGCVIHLYFHEWSSFSIDCHIVDFNNNSNNNLMLIENASSPSGSVSEGSSKLKMPHLLSSSEFYLYEVEFKRNKEYFEKSATCPEDFEIGDYVKVEGSRGQHIGVIINIELKSSEEVSFFSPDGHERFKKIVCRASEFEKRNLMTKIRDEDRALHICNELASRRRLPILIVDAEFQTDRNKLTFSYMCDQRVDFRELVRDLFSLFKTRIWMQKLDCNGNPIHSTMSSNDPTSPALDTSQYHQQYAHVPKQGIISDLRDKMSPVPLVRDEDISHHILRSSTRSSPGLHPQTSEGSIGSLSRGDQQLKEVIEDNLGNMPKSNSPPSFASLEGDLSELPRPSSSRTVCVDHNLRYQQHRLAVPQSADDHYVREPASSSRPVYYHPQPTDYDVSAMTDRMGRMDPYSSRVPEYDSARNRSTSQPSRRYPEQQRYDGGYSSYQDYGQQYPLRVSEPSLSRPVHIQSDYKRPPYHRSAYNAHAPRYSYDRRAEGERTGSSSYVPNLVAPEWEPPSTHFIHSPIEYLPRHLQTEGPLTDQLNPYADHLVQKYY